MAQHHDSPPDHGTHEVRSSNTGTTHEVQRLKSGSVGVVGVIFMAVATAAPITAMTGNVPIAIGWGNGAGAPAGYIVATVVLALFALGYATMAKHITATGAFYGYISHGLGRVAGMASGLIVTMAYVVFEASIIGIFSYFAQDAVNQYFHVEAPWIMFAMLMLVANCVLAYYDINLTAKVLGAFLITEIVMLAIGAVYVLVSGGGPDGIPLEPINPVNAFTAAQGVTGAAAGLGLFFAFWSWVGFESTAMYGEESKDPKRVIPIATMVAVVGVGIFYVFVSWMAVAGAGLDHAIDLAQNDAFELYFAPVRQLLGNWAIVVFHVLMVTGSFACGMAFHNCASRYLYALGREGLSPRLASVLGRTHDIHGSPHGASFVQSGITLLIVLAFRVTDSDPYLHMYGLLAILGTMAILIVQALTAFSVVAYFHGQKKHPETAHWFKTFTAPLLGGIAMLYVIYLLWSNKETAAGDASSTLLFKMTPYIVVGTFLLGALIALYFKFRDPVKYERIGRIVLEDTTERE